MQKTWVFPTKGFVKVNVHAFTLPEPYPNGNDSCIRIMIRDHKGTIIVMVYGTIRNLTERANELWAILAGLKMAFLEGEEKVELESDNAGAVKEWEEWMWDYDRNHENVIQQLNQRKTDPNLSLVVRAVEPSQNALARYLAHMGSLQRTRLVIIRRLFGEVKELWSLDMGLGTTKGNFEAMSEEEYENWLWEDEEEEDQEAGVIEITDDEDEEAVAMLMDGVGQPGMGGRQ
ncbi:hypothetical protein DCAR_0311244 [Daucus carota subsp. sativus]|uniref:RNase H type-1 domain-containing protein n=1 Tax=Daucus carota subsp. sativus TaxID=79200 RepID=A0A161WRA7_DAUCS|nr:hypothetical protein DCAR_0311244 [Daucus carota subsp. sativus]